MSPEIAGIIGVVLLVILLFLRVWVGIAMALVGFLGFAYITSLKNALLILGSVPYSTLANETVAAVPLFILMGAMVSNTGVAGDLYKTAYKWLGQYRGGLAMATIMACGGFAAMCGSSQATVATIGKVAMPEMKKYRYDMKLTAGSVAAGGTIGILIPPSIGFILYGILTEESIGKLFMAGIIPGVLEAVFYMVTIFILCRLNPKMGPPGPGTSTKEKIISLKNTWAMLALFCLVMGGIYMGIFTPTEAGSTGAFGAIIISFVGRRLTWANLRGSIVETAQTTAMIVFMIVGAFMFMRFLAISQLPNALGEFVTGLPIPRMWILVAIIFMYIIIGCFLDIYAAIILTVPIIFSAILALGFDVIWFGVILVRVMEIGLVTPPFGLNIFILASVSDVPIGTMYRGIVPFVIADFAHVALLVAIPSLSLFLPQTM